jgi:MFS family permease
MNKAPSLAEPARPAWHGVAALAVLFVVRCAVSFQFQSVAPLSPLLESRFPVSLSGLGVLLGLYMAPGIGVALGLPSLIARCGRASTIIAAFLLMACGEAMLWWADDFGLAATARFVAGTGGCVIYIITINMVADLDAVVGRAARMGIIAAAWPFGNAAALVLLGVLAHSVPETARWVPLGFVVVSLGAIASLLVRSGVGLPSAGSFERPSLARWATALRQIGPIALSFALYNIGFIIFTGFSSRILIEDGIDPSTASAIAALPMWMFLLSVPFGGIVAGRSLRGDQRLVAISCLVAAACVVASSMGEWQVILYVIAGLVGGLPTAPMLFHGRMATGESTDITYSALFFVFFALLLVLPALAGKAADAAESPHLILWIIGGLLGLSVALFTHAGLRPRGEPAAL